MTNSVTVLYSDYVILDVAFLFTAEVYFHSLATLTPMGEKSARKARVIESTGRPRGRPRKGAPATPPRPKTPPEVPTTTGNPPQQAQFQPDDNVKDGEKVAETSRRTSKRARTTTVKFGALPQAPEDAMEIDPVGAVPPSESTPLEVMDLDPPIPARSKAKVLATKQAPKPPIQLANEDIETSGDEELLKSTPELAEMEGAVRNILGPAGMSTIYFNQCR